MAERSDASFCFVHAADLHLDTPFAGVHAVAPFVANELREASLAAFDAIVELSLERKAAFLVVAGDIYDGAERGLRAQLRFATGLDLLSREGIPSFVVHGNHDPVKTGWSAISSWPTGVTVFTSDEVGMVPVRRDGEVIATVQGISFANSVTTENLALGFSRPDLPGVHVGVLHCNVGADAEHGDYSPCSLEDLRRAQLDYWALGHIHSRRTLAEGAGPGDPWVVYPGNSQARSPKPSERGPKGAVVVHVERGRVCEVEFVACDRVRFDEVDCGIDDLAGDHALAERLTEIGRERLAAADGRSLVLRARLTGRGPLHADLARPGSLDDFLTELRTEAGERQPFCWWDEIVDASRPEIDREEIRHRGDFAADLLGVADAARVDLEQADAVMASLCAEAPRALSGALSKLVGEGSELEALFDEATTVALDAIGAGS